VPPNLSSGSCAPGRIGYNLKVHRKHDDSATTVPESTPNASGTAQEKQRVALTSVVAAVLLTAMKVVVGVSTGSLGVLSEALHSALDLVAALITLFAVRAAARPADDKHPYGHGKVENLSALVETALLLVTCVWIIYEAVRRLLFAHVEVEPSIWAFAVLAVSIVVDISRSRALRRVAVKTGSQALEADALHFSTDVWSSSVVMVGLGLVWLARELGRPGLVKADAVAALVVAGIVVWVGLRLGRRSVADLLDEVPPGLKERVEEAARVDGVREVVRVRVRRSGPESFVDCTLRVEAGASLERGHHIAEAAENAIRGVLPGADVVVHVEPGDEPQEAGAASVPAVVRRVASALGLPAHDLHLQRLPGGLSLELHVEVPEHLSVADAHARTDELEAAIRDALPDLRRVVTHIEPAEGCAIPQAARPAAESAVRVMLEDLAACREEVADAHDVTVCRVGEELHLTCHLTVEPDTPIADAHRVTQELEEALRNRFPDLGRVVIHVEPPDA
jgi:cation diffusion facilitator family transporter